MKLTSYRRITQIVFVLFIFFMPVLNIFRYDMDTHDLIMFGTILWGIGTVLLLFPLPRTVRIPRRN